MFKLVENNLGLDLRLYFYNQINMFDANIQSVVLVARKLQPSIRETVYLKISQNEMLLDFIGSYNQ